MKAYRIPRLKLSYVSDSTAEQPRITGSKDVADLLRKDYEEGEIETQEYFKVLYLNQANKFIGIHTVSMGGVASTVVDAKLVFGGALTAKASAIILCHNHPSGQLKPSAQDDALTRRLVDGAKVLDIKVLDHIVLTADGYYSYTDEGRLPR